MQRKAVAILPAAALILLSAPCIHAGLIARYEFNGNLSDSEPAGNDPSLVSHGGTVGATSYSFAENQGLSVDGVLPAPIRAYTILLQFAFSSVAGFNKVVDFKNRTSDPGVYIHNGLLRFSGVSAQGTGETTIGTTPISDNVTSRVVITRNDSNNRFTAYLNGNEEFHFSDSTANNESAVFNVSNGIMHFFNDDTLFGSTEASGGVVDLIEIYDEPLTASQVAALNAPAAVPEPSSVAMAMMGLGVLVAFRRSIAAAEYRVLS